MMSQDPRDIAKIRDESSAVATEKAHAELAAEERRAREATPKPKHTKQRARSSVLPRQFLDRIRRDTSTPTLFFLNSFPKLDFIPAYFFHPEEVLTMRQWGDIVWQRWNAWFDAKRQAAARYRRVIPSLQAKCGVLIAEAYRTGIAFWAWDGLSCVPVRSSGMELRLWTINQLNVLRGIESAPRRWMNEVDKLALSGEDIAVLNLARPLFEHAELDEAVWDRWQGELLLTRWPDNPKNKFVGLARGGLLSRATGEAAYYQELIRITWERMRNLATRRPDRLIPLPEEPIAVADNQTARRALDYIVAFSGAWIQADESQQEQDSQSPRITLNEANEKAKLLAKADRSFVKEPSIRKWAEAIGCSTGLVAKLPFWRALMVKTGRGRKDSTPTPKAVSLTSNLEAAVGDGTPDEALERLLGEHQADFESSPLEEDPPDGRPQTVRTRKCL